MMRRSLRCGIPILAALVLVAGAGVNASAQTREDLDTAKRLVGRLVSYTDRLADGTIRQDPRTVGYIIYSDVGRMCYLQMDPRRPNARRRSCRAIIPTSPPPRR